MLLHDLRRKVLETARRMSGEGLVRSTWGNVSALDHQSGLIAITPSNAEYHEISPTDVPLVNQAGLRVEGHLEPSSEFRLHLRLLSAGFDWGAVVHTHSPYATAAACLGVEFPIYHSELRKVLGISARLARFAEAGSEELAGHALESLEPVPATGAGAVLLRNHGAVAVGRDLKEAYAAAWGIESAAQTWWLIRSLAPNKSPLVEEEGIMSLRV